MRAPEKCAHGIPFFGVPYPVCRDCDLIWEYECLAMAEKAVERHTRRLAAWGVDPKAGTTERLALPREDQEPPSQSLDRGKE